MRIFETILVMALFASVLADAFSGRGATAHATFLPRLAIVLLAVALVALALHLAFEGPHWQMFAAYAACIPAGVLAWLVWPPASRGGMIAAAVAGLLLAISCAFSSIVPMFRLPQPSGPYAVGTSILYMVDTSRLEDAAPASGRNRELMVQLWYPAGTDTGKLAPYRQRQEVTYASSYQAVLPTHSRLDAPVARAASPYPVLLFNPAWTGRRTQDTFLTEELASHGYLVAAIDHTYNSEPVAFPDGRVVWANHVPSIETLVNTTPEEVIAVGNKEADKEAADDRFVLDELSRLNKQQGSRWFGSMDTTMAGAFGHSLGGAVSIETWATDPRVHAAVNLDGWQLGTHSSQGVRVAQEDVSSPSASSSVDTYRLLFLYEALDNSFNAPPSTPEPGKKTWTPVEVEAAVSAWDVVHVKQLLERYGGQALVLQGSIHPTFTDKPLTSPIKRLSGRSDIDAIRAHAIIRDYVVQFFDLALKGTPSPLLDGRGDAYPEMQVLLQVRNPAQVQR